ncbi:hypothetical protein E0H73_06390 [Kribbella pittospori]|uniref:Uncharacterized protein n=1 Tax=Kribbella pittospori TaxID=722689 RepID=A0A4R0L6F4_9ACTN|nr:hypothetical protein [Kribbella pittospori]TCC66498.1 hypothetical protein E0H73_06390 [Kribbella pittospori]
MAISDHEPDYLDRLARSEPLDSWQPEDLRAALAVVDDLDAQRPHTAGTARVIDLRLAIYRSRLRYELSQRVEGEPEH